MSTSVPIADQVDAMHLAQAAEPPNPVKAVFRREQAELAVVDVPDGVLTLGSPLPDAKLLDSSGTPITFYESFGDGVTVVVFYRGAWCPYCNIALAAYQQHLLPELTRRGVALIAISPQTPDGSLSMEEKQSLTFTVLSDPGNTLATALGVLTGPSAEARETQLRVGLDLTTVNADATTTLPMPTALIVDADHVLRWIDVHPDYSTRTEPSAILAALDALSG